MRMVVRVKLLVSLIENKLLKFDEDELNNKINHWNFYQARALVGLFKRDEIRKKNDLWKKVLIGDEKAILLMNLLVYKDRKEIYNRMTKVYEVMADEKKVGDFWKKGRFAVTKFEYT